MATTKKSTASKKAATPASTGKTDGTIQVDEATAESLANANAAAADAQPTIPDGPPNAPAAVPSPSPITSAGIEAANSGDKS